MASVVVVNTGSSSLKLSVVQPSPDGDADEVTATATVRDPEPFGPALAAFLDEHRPDVVAHRFVHGPVEDRSPRPVTDALRKELDAAVELAPLHLPRALEALDAAVAAAPGVPQVACFDTAFHATVPAAAARYPVPDEWAQRWGVRRVGFHGFAHEWAARRGAQLIGCATDELRIVTAQLGAGASLCAVDRGRSVDTTMGFTPLEGIVMGTRSGTVDPGLLLWLLRTGRLDAETLGRDLENRSGLAALAGTPDMAAVVAAAGAGDDRARAALDVYGHRLRAGFAAMAASLGGVDLVVFSGGIGEHAPVIRAEAAAGLGFLGVAVEEAANAAAVGVDAVISPDGAAVAVAVVVAREDLVIAEHARTAVAAG
jgi:acetate kinase